MNNPDESLLLRWSRRKQEAREQKVPEPAVPAETPEPAEPEAASLEPQQPETAVAAEESTGEPAGPEVDLSDLPDVETLTYESDFTAFLREGVPEHLKQAALRKLWLSDPVFANLDGLNDYDPKTMKFLEQAVGEPVAEVGRALRDKIMDAKRAREERPRGRHGPSGERRAAVERARDQAERTQAAAADDDTSSNDDVGEGDVAAPDERHDS